MYFLFPENKGNSNLFLENSDSTNLEILKRDTGFMDLVLANSPFVHQKRLEVVMHLSVLVTKSIPNNQMVKKPKLVSLLRNS